MKKDKKLEAIKLRKKNKSYSEIAKFLEVSKSTVSYWLKDVNWSRDIKIQLTKRAQKISRERLERLNELKNKKWKVLYENAEKEAIREYKKNQNNKVFLTGISLYWGEGDKNFTNGQVRISNVDEKLLVAFIVFLKKICKVNSKSIKAYLLLYPDLDEKESLDFWSKETKIARSNFFKSSVVQGRHRNRKLKHGVCSIIVSNKCLKKKILTWLELFAREF